MTTLLLLLGLAVLLGLLYLLYIGAAVPPALQKVVILAAVLFLLFCLMEMAGCAPPFLHPAPQAEAQP